MDKYKVVRTLGKGSYGEVFLVTEREASGRDWVLKKMDLGKSSRKGMCVCVCVCVCVLVVLFRILIGGTRPLPRCMGQRDHGV